MSQDPQVQSEKLPFLPRRKKFLIPIVILLAALMIGLPAGVLIGSSAVKSSEVFGLTMDRLKASEVIRQALGEPIEPGRIASGSHDDRNGTYELTFKVYGPRDRAVVRCWCVSQGEGQPWQIEHLAVGIGGRAGREITLVGDPKDPPWSVQ